MTEQYKDAYQSKYREETAQIHAPLSLIEKTKAAMREEQKRLAAAAQERESGMGSAVAQRTAASSVMQKKQEGMSALDTGYENRQNHTRAFSVRKWAYPLTAAAAILILTSVSLTMRGLKSVNMSGAPSAIRDGAAESGAAYDTAAPAKNEEAAAGAAYEEEAEAPMMDSMQETAAEDMMTDMVEGAAADGVTEAQNTNDAAYSETEQTNGLMRGDEGMDMAAPAEGMQMEEAAEAPAGDSAKKELQNSGTKAQEQKRTKEDGIANLALDRDDITMEKVEKKPAFCDLPDAKTRVYEGENFIIRKEKSGWAGYTETEDGTGYLFHGEMEDQKEFLQAMSELLAETGGVQEP